MEKIYFIRGKESTDLDNLLSLLFDAGGYSVETYYDEEFTSTQCYRGSRRSFEDLLCIANTYYPETTEEQLMQAIVNVDLAYYYCSDIHKIVFHFSGFHKPSLHGFEIEKWADVTYRPNTYTLPMLQKIYNNLKIEASNLTLGESC